MDVKKKPFYVKRIECARKMERSRDLCVYGREKWSLILQLLVYPFISLQSHTKIVAAMIDYRRLKKLS